MQLGINVSPDLACAPDQLARIGARWVRVVITPDVDAGRWLAGCRDMGIRPLLVIARESLGDEPADRAIAAYADRYGALAAAWQIGNEPDQVSDSSWTLAPEALNQLVACARAELPRATIVAAGMVSGDPSYLESIDLDRYDAIAVHPYGRRPAPDWPATTWGTGYLGDLLAGYTRFGKPIWITELGISSDEVGEALQAEYLARMIASLREGQQAPVVLVFCHQPRAGFGLVRPDGAEKPSFRTFVRASRARARKRR